MKRKQVDWKNKWKRSTVSFGIILAMTVSLFPSDTMEGEVVSGTSAVTSDVSQDKADNAEEKMLVSNALDTVNQGQQSVFTREQDRKTIVSQEKTENESKDEREKSRKITSDDKVTLASASGQNGKSVAEAKSSSASDAGRQIADEKAATVPEASALKKMEYINLKEGTISKYGQQSVSFVDQNGKNVELQEVAESVSGVTSQEVQEMTGDAGATSASASNQSSLASVRNQGSWGLCWAFASTAALEANILIKKTCSSVSATASELDLSERHMGWFAHNTYSTLATDPTKKTDGVKKTTAKAAYTGGNYYQATAYLARGSGMELEENVPYSSSMGGVIEADRYDSVVTLHDSYSVSYDTVNDAQNSIDAVKNLVDTYGAAGCSYLSKDAGYSGTSAPEGMAFYQKSRGTNHAVCIVGYDDNFAVSNFTGAAGQPEKPGAWLVRNSWGSGWGNNGYFWLSYYDASISQVFAFEVADSSDYGDIYQYDATGSNSYLRANATANVFKARRDDTVKSVGIYLSSALASGTIQIYTSDTKPINPADGKLVATNAIPAITNGGYHIVDLTNTVSVKEGQYFSVVVTLGDSGSSAMYCFEGKSKCKASAGQSYYLYGGQWNDSYKITGNACIKAIMTSETDTAKLDEVITDASNITKASLSGLGGDTLYSWIQKEILAANAAKKSGSTDDVTRAVKRLGRVLSQTGSRKIFIDSAKTTGPGTGGAQMYVNGGKYKKDGITNIYGARTYYFSVDKVLSWKPYKGMFRGAYYGNYVVATTTTDTKPTLNAEGKIENPDTDAAKIVKTKLSGTKVTVTPLQKGTVYVWVLYFPKGGKCYASDVDDYAVTKVTVGAMAPSAVKLYDTAQKAKNCADTTVTQYLSTVMPQGGSTSVYVAGTTGTKTKKVNTLAACELDGTNYEPVVPVKYKDYIKVIRDTAIPNKFTIQTASDILDVFKVKTNKTLAVSIPFYCNKNSKKINFKVVIGNPVKSMSFAAGTGVEAKNDAGILDVKIAAPTTKTASSGTIIETKTLYNINRSCTDSTAVLRMAKADDIIYSSANVLGVSTTLTAVQKKVSIALQKDKMTYKITAAKGTPAGTVVYFVIRHNAYQHTSGTGYQIVKVTVE